MQDRNSCNRWNNFQRLVVGIVLRLGERASNLLRRERKEDVIRLLVSWIQMTKLITQVARRRLRNMIYAGRYFEIWRSSTIVWNEWKEVLPVDWHYGCGLSSKSLNFSSWAVQRSGWGGFHVVGCRREYDWQWTGYGEMVRVSWLG